MMRDTMRKVMRSLLWARRGAVLASLLVLVGATLAACDDGDDTTTVTLATHDSFFVPEEVLDEFTEETGIEVEVLQRGDAGEVLSQMILAKDDPIADAVFGVDSTLLPFALDRGIFAEYVSPALENVPDELVADPRVTPVDHGHVCINFDRVAFTDVPAPATLADLTDPRYEGQLVVTDPATSSPGHAFLFATIAEYGPDGWQDYWADLRANGVTVVSGWNDAWFGEFSGAGEGGTHPLVLSYGTSPPATVDAEEDPLPDEAPVGTMLGSCLQQVEYVGVLEGAENPEAAEQLIDFMLSPTFQEALPLSMFVFPVVEGTPLPEVFERYADVPEDPYTMPDDVTAEQREAWIEQWTDVVVR